MKILKTLILAGIILIPAAASHGAQKSVGEAITARRSIRRFKPEPIQRNKLIKITEAGNLASTAGNLQPWEFIIIDSAELTDKVFPRLGWLGGPPEEGQRPAAYIALLIDKNAMDSWSHVASAGAALQNIQLSAWGKGIGSCCFGSIERDAIAPILGIPDDFYLFVIIALGYPDENPVVKKADDSLRPYRDAEGILHVPKKPLRDILHFGKFNAEERMPGK